MATINLRPWREERRERLKKQFINITAIIGGVGLVVGLIWLQIVNGMIGGQNSRNSMLQSEIAVLDQKVEEINKLKRKKDDLLERMQVIQNLQGNRPLIVHIFDELARTVPDGVFYSRMERKGDKIFLEGTAEANSRVSSLMRRLDESEYFINPNLTKVIANPNVGDQGNDFVLTVDLEIKSQPMVSKESDGEPQPDKKGKKGKKGKKNAAKGGKK
ncbi:MAG: PilN domain-containing protein [Pseudomonadales bacterium]|nr:PilN domain-containing protein [Pseudomonadales bacterium]